MRKADSLKHILKNSIKQILIKLTYREWMKILGKHSLKNQWENTIYLKKKNKGFKFLEETILF